MRFLKRLIGAALLTLFVGIVLRFPLEMINMWSDTIDWSEKEIGLMSSMPALIGGLVYLFWRRKPRID